MTELSPEAKKLFELSRRSFSPREERIAKVGAVIAAQVGLAVAASTSASAATAVGKGTAAWLSTTKLVGVVFVVASVGASAVAVPRFLGRTEPAAVTSGPPSIAAQAPRKEASSMPEASAIRLEALKAAHPPPDGSRRAEVERAPLESDAPPTPATEKVRLEETEEADGVKDRGAPPVPQDPLMDEIALVRGARAALDSGNAARTLALLNQHATQYPRGALGEERLALRVLALCRLGRVAEARASATALERVSPRSPHLERIRTSCAGAR